MIFTPAQAESYVMRYMFEALANETAPFHMGELSIEMTDSFLEPNHVMITARVAALPEHYFRVAIDMEEVGRYPEAAAEFVGVNLGKQIASVYVAPEHNVSLGEN